VHIYYGSQQVAVQQACAGRRQRSVDPSHFEGLAESRPRYRVTCFDAGGASAAALARRL
jgi:hypothetical protein